MKRVQHVATRRRDRRDDRLTKRRLESLVEEATVDAYGESEHVSGLFTMIEDNLSIPFEITILGRPAMVEKLDLSESGEIVAVCRAGPHRQRIPILDVRLPIPRPTGSEWIEAYRYWCTRWR